MKNFLSLIIRLILLLSMVACDDWRVADGNRYPGVDVVLRRPGDASLRFIVLSDWGFNGSDGQKSVAAQMGKVAAYAGAEFVLTCGDNFQYMGVDSVDSPLWQINFESVYADSSLQIPWFPALGNHDYYGHPDAEIEYSAVSKRWKMPSRYYSFTRMLNVRDSVRFIVLDTQGFLNDCKMLADSSQIDSVPQYKWLKTLLAASKARYIITTGHHPVYSSAPHHGDTPELKKYLLPLFNEYKVDWYLSGHDHNFEHAKDVTDYTHFIVTGTGGYVRAAGANNRTVYSVSELGFTYINVAADTLKLYFITSDGKVGYQYQKAGSR